ncbi:MFS general substrate transporter [Fomitiporia mediterranea MF3/22]|uniref:MFS general substrate transporter n=1 Tax=Fomitiporia mediterranea (strain MF3/22) TaxID=694068 RepID=UPI0004408A87|nr:MFS general substrate transporter [Fomitiporia mediterranea MF3/22]EJD00933.1 MFS general substrate transporter [Fomitiporia mediterranea MF3/22]
MPLLHRVRHFVWGEIPATKEERNLLFKIDWFILSYCCLMYFTNYLDRSNVANAYVSGMKEELNMHGTDYNKINTFFTCGYIVGMIPNNLMLQVVQPRIWFPVMQIVWGVLTFCSSAVSTVQQIWAIRFLQGIAESSTFVGTHYVLGSWYKPAELGKRSGIFTSSGLVGTLFSGVLQAAVYKNLNGHAGRSGWRWLFIIDGVITLPIALYGFMVFPNVPATTDVFYISERERRLASSRLENTSDAEINIDTSKGKLSWDLARRVLGRWRWYGCSLLFAISGETESFGSNNLMGQWLKAIGGYSVAQIDYYPSGQTAFAIASTLVCATWTDYTRKRWPVLVYMSIACIVSSILILVWSTPIAAKFFAYYLSGASYAGQATTFAWANQICADDHQERAVVLASMNMWNNVINAWWPLLFYAASDAPRFKKGMIAMICTCIATLGVTALVWWLERRERRRTKRARKEEMEVVTSRTGPLDEKVDQKSGRESDETNRGGKLGDDESS